MQLTDFDVLSFDCYGTLIDWEQGLIDAFTPWLDGQGRSISRDEILETYADIESELEVGHPGWPYPEILGAAIRRLASVWKVPVSGDDVNAFSSSVPDWPAFPDSSEALRYLQQHYRLVILSNIDRRSFAASAKRLGIRFDHVFTAEDIGSYKPDPRNFDFLLEQMKDQGIAPAQILHTAQSLFHDHVPAKAKGLATAWIDRRQDQSGWGATPRAASVEPDFQFPSLEAMARAHRLL